MTEREKIALVTGASGGIGQATTLALAEADWTVYAAARKPDAIATLAGPRVRPIALDVTDDVSMRAAVDHVLAESGRIDLLVNNAGYGLYGPLEEIGLEDLRRQIETNVVGLVRMSQLVLPTMRRQRSGRIVNVGSVGGVITTPMGGAYHATKYAVEAISDVLRVEVATFGIDVVLVQPTGVRTGFFEKILETMPQTGPGSPYAAQKRGFTTMMTMVERGTGILSPNDVAGVIVRAATARRPRTRYKAGASAYALAAARTLLPDRVWDALMQRGLAMGAEETARNGRREESVTARR